MAQEEGNRTIRATWHRARPPRLANGVPAYRQCTARKAAVRWKDARPVRAGPNRDMEKNAPGRHGACKKAGLAWLSVRVGVGGCGMASIADILRRGDAALETQPHGEVRILSFIRG